MTSARALFDLWIDAAEEAYAEAALSPDFRTAYGALVNAQMLVRAGVQREVELIGGLVGLPGRTEMDAAHRRLAEVERELRRLRAARGGGGIVVPGAPPRATSRRRGQARHADDDGQAGAPAATGCTRAARAPDRPDGYGQGNARHVAKAPADTAPAGNLQAGAGHAARTGSSKARTGQKAGTGKARATADAPSRQASATPARTRATATPARAKAAGTPAVPPLARRHGRPAPPVPRPASAPHAAPSPQAPCPRARNPCRPARVPAA